MKKIIVVIILSIISFTYCRPPQNQTFYWGEYSSTLYDLKKNPSEKTLEAHKKQILLIFEESNKKKLRIPPGVYAEYGYILLKEGMEKDGMEYLDKEVALYPESLVFIKQIKAEYERGKK